MLDTVKLHSPYISEDVANQVERHLNTRSGVQNSTGTIMYEIVGGEVQLEGSYDHRVRVAVLRKRSVWVPGKGTRRGQTVIEECPPYLEVEGSVHKAMAGHNVWGGPPSIREPITWLIFDLARYFDCWLPYAPTWDIQRLDWANVYDLGSHTVVGDYLWALNQASYPRRRAQNYGRTGAFFPGDATSVKFYHKGVEFQRHDYGRIRRAPFGGVQLANEVRDRANRLLRVEVSIKAPTLDRAYDRSPTVDKVSPIWVADLWEREVQKVVREGRTDMEVVRKAVDVRARLGSLHSRRLASAVYATWVGFSTVGEEQTKLLMAQDTFYRHRRFLEAAGCSWHGTDVQLVDAVPSFGDFVPTLTHRSRVLEVHPRVLDCLGRVA